MCGGQFMVCLHSPMSVTGGIVLCVQLGDCSIIKWHLGWLAFSRPQRDCRDWGPAGSKGKSTLYLCTTQHPKPESGARTTVHIPWGFCHTLAARISHACCRNTKEHQICRNNLLKTRDHCIWQGLLPRVKSSHTCKTVKAACTGLNI